MRKEALEYYVKKITAFADAEKRLFDRVIPSNLDNIKSIHLSGICGTAMGSLAVLLHKAGFTVSGSDTHCYPPMSSVIEELGIVYFNSYDGENLKGADLVIVGNVCGPDNAEAAYAREHNIPTLSLPEAIGSFFIEKNKKKSIVVAGTHGKTTTTALLTHIFKQNNMNPGYMIGGVMGGNNENAAIGMGEHFILEGDEYDTSYFDKAPKFLHYMPTVAIVTSLEFDHADIYKDIDAYTDAFKFLVQEVPASGLSVLCGDIPAVRGLGECANSTVLYYGFDDSNDIIAKNITTEDGGQRYDLFVDGKNLGTIKLSLFGRHNILNSLACVAVSLHAGISFEGIQKAVGTFEGVKRRQEVIYDGKLTVIDDFAHHPTAVKETLQAIRGKYPNRRLVAFFEPRSSTSRRKMFEDQYGDSFDAADLVFISTPPLKSVDNTSDFMDPAYVVERINGKGDKKAYNFSNADGILESYTKMMQKGDVVLVMSNGAFDGIHGKLVEICG